MQSVFGRATVTASTLTLLGLAACGGAQPAPEAPSQATEPSAADAGYGPQAYPQPGAAPPPGQAVDSGGGEFSPSDIERFEAELAQGEEEIDVALGDAESAAQPLDSSACEQRVCRALRSMRESAEGICRLSADDPPRCERARERLTKSYQRVERSGCECSDP